MKKLYLVGACLLVLALVVGIFGCAPAAAPAPEKTKVEIMTGRPGDSWTVLSYALSGFINEHSEILKASVLTTGGTSDPFAILKEEPERKPFSVINAEAGTIWSTGVKALFLGAFGNYPFGYVTYDPDIRTLEDFAGKKVATARESEGWVENFTAPLELAGVLDKVDLSHTGFGGAMSSLIDGAVDIAYCDFTYVYPDTFKYSSLLQQAATKGPLYFPDWGKERIEVGLSAAVPWGPSRALEIPAGALAENSPRSTIYVWLMPFWFGATIDMEEDVAYEITRIMYERGKEGEFAGLHAQGAGVAPGSVEYGPWKTKEEIEEWYHPGALKYYREMGVSGL